MKREVPVRANWLHGTGVVMRQQMRRARFARDVAAVCGTLVGLGVLSAALCKFVFDWFDYRNDNLTWTLRLWLSPCAMGATLLVMGAGAVCGAAIAPRSAAAEEIQSSLLAGLSPLAICGGRLLAGLRIPVIVLLLSTLLWSLAQAAAPVVPPEAGGFGAIVLAHLVLGCTLFMTGSIAFAFQAGARGRSWGGGLAAGLFVAGALIGSPLIVNSWLQATDDPSGILQILLLLNPVFAVESALGRDTLHVHWIYAHTTAADYLVDTLPPLASAGVFFMIGLAAFAVAAWRLRAAIRR